MNIKFAVTYSLLSVRTRALSGDSVWTKWRLFTKLCMKITTLELWGFKFPTKIKLQIKLVTTCKKIEQQEGTESKAEL